jgi:hypothetical protein
MPCKVRQLPTCEDDAGDDWSELAGQRQRQHASHRARQTQLCKLPHELVTVDTPVNRKCTHAQELNRSH